MKLPPQHAFFVLHTSKGIRVESIAEWWKSYLRGYRRFNIQFDIRNTPLDRRAINIDTIRQVTRVNKPYIKKVLWDWLGWKYIRGKWGHEYEEYYLEIYKDEISGYDKVFGYEFKDHIDEYSIEVVASLLSSAWFTPERGEENWEEKVIEEVKRNLL
ncbi:MAG: hypothetical protein N3C61_00880 [Candidatus Micrarchaeota archaeon]|nr:hypothetical protein [Candidatus Micrarchaeota archaeon]